MIEEHLLNYGILGLWTITLLADKYKFYKDMKIVLEANTGAINNLQKKLK